jgi:hypothetical protein
MPSGWPAGHWTSSIRFPSGSVIHEVRTSSEPSGDSGASVSMALAALGGELGAGGVHRLDFDDEVVAAGAEVGRRWPAPHHLPAQMRSTGFALLLKAMRSILVDEMRPFG